MTRNTGLILYALLLQSRIKVIYDRRNLKTLATPYIDQEIMFIVTAIKICQPLMLQILLLPKTMQYMPIFEYIFNACIHIELNSSQLLLQLAFLTNDKQHYQLNVCHIKLCVQQMRNVPILQEHRMAASLLFMTRIFKGL